MSRMKSEEEYRKTKAFHFFRWLSGEKDPYVGNLEMKASKGIHRRRGVAPGTDAGKPDGDG